MKIKELIVENQLNEMIDPQILSGLEGLGIGSAVVVLMNLAMGIAPITGDVKDSPVYGWYKKLKTAWDDKNAEKLANSLTKEQLDKLYDEMKDGLTKNQLVYVKTLERNLASALKHKNYKLVSKYFNDVKNYKIKTDRQRAFFKKNEVTEAKKFSVALECDHPKDDELLSYCVDKNITMGRPYTDGGGQFVKFTASDKKTLEDLIDEFSSGDEYKDDIK